MIEIAGGVILGFFAIWLILAAIGWIQENTY
jgi:hypothetical protein